MLCNWVVRGWTDAIFFAAINDDVVIDKIPLAEVKVVQEMRTAQLEGDENSKHVNELMIETHPDGYNSGRTYYLQAESRVSCQEIISKLTQHASKAYERTHTNTVFTHTRRFAGKVFRTSIFQNFFAFLIVAVSWHASIMFIRWLLLWYFFLRSELCSLCAGCAIQERRILEF